MITHSLETTHTVRLVLALVSFSIAMTIASHLHHVKGSALLGRILLVMFSFSITLTQVARWDDLLKWNSLITMATLVVGVMYCAEMVRETTAPRRAQWRDARRECQ